MSDQPFFTIVGEWPWQLIVYHTPTPRPSPPLPSLPKPPEKTWKLVDAVADQLGLSRGKVRTEVQRGHVVVDSVVEMDADRMLTSQNEVEWTTPP